MYMIELKIDQAAWLRFLHREGLDDEDFGYGLHAWLKAAFGELAPKPFRLFLKRPRPLRVLAYSTVDAAALRDRLTNFADPAVYAACPPEYVDSRKMPQWQSGRRLAFEVLCCPVRRRSTTSGVREKDVFLVHADHTPKKNILDRTSIYRQWLEEQFSTAAQIHDLRLEGFQLIRQTRRTQTKNHQRKRFHPMRPQALLRGECVIQEENKFFQLVARGIGRHRAFGYGMLLLRPPR
ncbi:type I-E CRISPR-associated protein Cas6/Cse3/CasE [Methylohalobius crimeensis]|uniref:type I-E CRISPR-associated protein Cas6/Cse3/CasE n=1 Tax=Methylohalobius crimeensis TaxID=244365 RepID=UPI0003B723E6|nr:type I-E CRISPR-associated protein Cas6/Cse3/CasE [Methylohalobius crimeensis]